jgi:hypothetical protein
VLRVLPVERLAGLRGRDFAGIIVGFCLTGGDDGITCERRSVSALLPAE